MSKALWTKVPGKWKSEKKQKRSVRKQSKRHSKRLRRYHKLRKEFLESPENWQCHVCRSAEATEVHHRRGRLGPLLYDQKYWTPTCFRCGRRVHEKPEWAIKHGWLEKEGWHKTKP